MNTNNGTILIVDDIPANVSVLMDFLESAGYKILVATDGETAIEQAEYAQPDIILLDVMMPDIDGFETCERLKTSEATYDIPVIFMTALSETVDKVRGFEVGAADYVTKPFQQEEVLARVNAHLTLHRQKREIERLREQDRIQYENLSHMKDMMLSTASHDLKNPLTTIMMAAGLIRRYLPIQDARIESRLNQIESEVIYMRDLISNLLDLAQLEIDLGVEKEPVSLRELLKTNFQHIETQAAEKHISFVFHIDHDVTIYCDPFQMGQALQNLISNAVKYTPEGGKVEIGVDMTETQVSLHVKDTGIGIPEQAIPHLFEKFYRVDPKGTDVSGTGLGLAIVQKIIQQHGGNIRVQSKVGVGSTFSVSLPQ